MQETTMQQLWNSAYLAGGNADYAEALYERYPPCRNNGAATFKSCPRRPARYKHRPMMSRIQPSVNNMQVCMPSKQGKYHRFGKVSFIG